MKHYLECIAFGTRHMPALEFVLLDTKNDPYFDFEIKGTVLAKRECGMIHGREWEEGGAHCNVWAEFDSVCATSFKKGAISEPAV